MIVLTEHNAYLNKGFQVSEEDKQKLNQESFSKKFKRENGDDELCFSVLYDKETEKYTFDSSYIIGLDWVIEKKLAVQVIPKLNKENLEIDYQKMLFEALKEPENLNHLKGLYAIDFKAPKIPITQKQDSLTPLLIIEFLLSLKSIVKKGLKKSYYKVSEDLNGRVKGKVNISQTIKKFHPKGKIQFTNCSYEEFGYHSKENQLLKKGLEFSTLILQNYKELYNANQTLIHYVSSAFEKVKGEISINEIKNRKSNPFFKNYDYALQLAEQLLKKYDYTIANTSQKVEYSQPFWIDLPKLFELYVFKKLREQFPLRNEVEYHVKTNYQELDYIINAGETKMVVDAKYKPKYIKGGISNEDARQVSGYARLNSIYKKLQIEDDRLIDCLIVFPDNKQNTSINLTIKQKDDHYKKLFKIGIGLPVV